jgi:hypothetical protein
MTNQDLEIRLVRLEKHQVLVTTVLVVSVSFALGGIAAYLVQHLGLEGAGFAGAVAVVASYWLLMREVRIIEEPFMKVLERQKAEEAAAFDKWSREI